MMSWMRANVVRAVLMVSLSPALAGADPEVPAVILPTGIPILAYSNCSGAVARSSVWGETPVFLSAAHCFKDPRRNGGTNRTAYASNSALGLFDASTQALKFHTKDADWDALKDAFAIRIQGPIQKTKIHTVARSLPEIGAAISIWGYPGKGVPALGNVAKLNEFKCIYLGPIATPNFANKVNGKMTIFQAARCEKRFFIQGTSGGPVLNAQGEILGMFNLFVNEQVEMPDNYSYLYFSSVAEEDLLRDSRVTSGQALLPRKNGSIWYPIVNLMVTDEERTRNNPQSAKLYWKITVGHFDISFMEDMFHGPLKAYDTNGKLLVTEIWETGKLRGTQNP